MILLKLMTGGGTAIAMPPSGEQGELNVCTRCRPSAPIQEFPKFYLSIVFYSLADLQENLN